jgi:hypothetical protein
LRKIPVNDRFNKFLTEYPELAEALPKQMEHIHNLIFENDLRNNSEKRKSGEKKEMIAHMQRYLERVKTHMELLGRLLGQRDREGYTELMDFKDLGYMNRNLADLIDALNKYELKNAENALMNMSKSLENFGPTITKGSAVRDNSGSLRYVEGALRDIQTDIDIFLRIAPKYGAEEFDWVISEALRIVKGLDSAIQKTSHFERAIEAYHG